MNPKVIFFVIQAFILILGAIFYTYDTQKQLDGKFFTLSSLKYPLKIGITGHCFLNDVDYIATNEPGGNKYYQPEIDNTSGAGTVNNLIIGKIFS